jgi:hypothetical protein
MNDLGVLSTTVWVRVDQVVGLLAAILNRSRRDERRPSDRIGYYGHLVLMRIGREFYLFDNERLYSLRQQFLTDDDNAEYGRLLLTPVGGSPRRADAQRASRLQALERKILAGIYRLALAEHYQLQVDGGEPMLGRFGFVGPRLHDSWRVVDAILSDVWRTEPASPLVRVEEPFPGRILHGPQPLGSFFLPSGGLKMVAVARDALLFEYTDRMVVLGLNTPTIDVV